MLDIFKSRKEYQLYKKLIKKSTLFDSKYYLKQYGNFIEKNITPLEHYCRVGLSKNLKPNSEFDPIWYLEHYTDVKSDGGYPFIHYIIYGIKEKRFQNKEQFQNNLLLSTYYKYLNRSKESIKIRDEKNDIYNLNGKPLVNIIITFKDESESLVRCINSILKLSTYKNYKIIGISNNSKEIKTFNTIKKLNEKDIRISFYEHNIPCNDSKIKNYAIKNYATGEHIILLSSKIEITTANWIESMLKYSQRKNIGAVGTKLYCCDSKIEHFNPSMGVEFLFGENRKDLSHINIENISAVSTVCLMIKRSIFNEIYGLNEKKLIFEFDDIDFCLRIKERGYSNVITPYAEVYNHEHIKTHSKDTITLLEIFNTDVAYIKKRYNMIFKNRNLYK